MDPVPNQNNNNLDNVYEHKEKGNVNYIQIPIDTKHQHPQISNDLRISPSYDVSMRKLKSYIFQIYNSSYSPKFEGKITQGEWIANSAVIWDVIKRSPMILDYNKTLQSTNYKTNYYE